jgi:type I restriction enzyme S subunit
MPGERFEQTTFAELISEGVLEIGDGYRAKNDELGGDGLIFLRAGHVTDLYIDFSGVERFHTDLLPQLRSKLAKPGDAVITTKGNSTGRTAFVLKSMPPFVYSPHLSYWRSHDRARIDGRFLHYWSKGPEFLEQLAGMKASTDMAPYLSLVDQKRLHIALPPIPEQRAIAQILGTLDDKIELNWRMNETLEAMAWAIFKSWFVDFDPVRAKAEGRQPSGMDAALFPNSFQDSPLGKIPKGWKVAAIGDVVRAVGGSTPSTQEPDFWDGDINFATPKDLASLTSPVLLSTERRITDKGLQCISSGLLPKGTLLLSSRAPIGYLAVTEIPVTVNQGFIAMVCDRDLPNYYVLYWARENLDTIIANANGTTFLEISKQNFRPIKVIVPSPLILEAFVRLAEPLHKRVVANLKESKSLATIRDALLPKLLSGEIRVKSLQSLP